MSMAWSRKIRALLCTVLLSLSATAGAAYSTLYVLGDSLSDTGNLHTATGALPQPPYFDGRFSDGPIYAEYLWTSLGLAGALQPSYRGGTDYAVGGARSRYHAFDNSDPAFSPVGGVSSYFDFSLLGQRDALLKTLGGTLDSGALYTVWSGSNDVADAISLWASSAATALALVKQAVVDFVAVVQSLVAAGAHTLLIPNVPDLGLVPETVASGPDAQYLATQLAQLYNAQVSLALTGIAADVFWLDTFSVLGDVVNNPGSHGLPSDANVDSGCFSGYIGVPGTVCEHPASYVFWDQIHPSAIVHEELGRLAALKVPEPATVMLMVLALGALGHARHRRLKKTVWVP